MVPPKKFVAMIAKTNQKRKQTNNTFPIEGMQKIKASITTRIPCHLETALKGLKALNVLKARNPPISEAPVESDTQTIIKAAQEVATMVKSNMFQAFLKYFLTPKPYNFKVISTVNKTVKMISKIDKAFSKTGFLCRFASSKVRHKVEAKIRNKITFSNSGLSIILLEMVLPFFHQRKTKFSLEPK